MEYENYNLTAFYRHGEKVSFIDVPSKDVIKTESELFRTNPIRIEITKCLENLTG